MTNENSKKKMLEKLEMHLSRAKKEIETCEKLADEHGLSFSWDLAYGMGGMYHGKSSNRTEDNDDGRSEGKWVSSSQGC